jgi:adenine-specific DNA-methyltransferase
MDSSQLMSAHAKVCQLIYDFEEGISHYLSPKYQEQEVREDYINKFFSALGWDVNHTEQKNPFQQEVKIEKAQRQEGGLGQKRADYAFFLAPDFKQPQFFVEAKKPSRTLRKNRDDYFQTAKYGWNAGTGVSILTDFEEIVIVDCRFKPDFDTILETQIKYYNFKEFKDLEAFKEFYWIFSREALTAGNLVEYIRKLKKPKGSGKQLKIFGGKYQSIDDSFLSYIDQKRQELAIAFYKTNPLLDAYSLTEATQRTIDRLVFMRFLEDKIIEPENIVHSIATSANPWVKFVERTRFLDAKYNGIVFKPLFIDDKKFGGADDDMFRQLCSELDHTNTPYDFNYIPIHILGSIYERFLGKVVTIADGRATIEEKPEIKKAGGVFYTPKFIVDYIIENTIGKLIEGKTPKQISLLAFADIACGSGSFLIGAFEYLLDYHSKYYNENHEQAKKDGCNFNQELGVFVLSIKQKQQILLNNIYGVDIDLQATEVTQLSLFLKMLEDETTSSTNDMMVLFHEKILPNLSNNIKCGNSLISSDILSTKLDFDLNEERKLNPFDFSFAFLKVFKNGGFDVVIGNPPYYKVTDLNMLEYFTSKYKHQNYQFDLYLLFMERYKMVLKEGGHLGVIIPNTWLQSITFKKIRQYLTSAYLWRKVLYISEYVFKAVVDTHVLIFEKGAHKRNSAVLIEKLVNGAFKPHQTIFQKNIAHNGDIINILANPIEISLFNKIKSMSVPLKEISISTVGVKPFQKGKGKPKQTDETVKEKPYVKENQPKPEGENWLPLMRGSLMNKYENRWNNNSWIQYGEWLAEPRNPKFFNADEKIIIRQTSDRIIATIIGKDIICRNNLHILISHTLSHKFILGVLNSKVTDFYYYQLNPEQGEALAEVKKNHVEQLPIPKIDTLNQTIYHNIINYVNQMLSTKSQLSIATTERDTSYLERKYNSLESQINTLVYELYDLKPEDIDLIENVTLST